MNQIDAVSVKAKFNQHPQQRYELIFTIHDAPGPFGSADANIQYEVWNTGCVPSDLISGGKSKTPGFTLPIKLTRLSDTVYRGEVALDLPMDEDYFGLGVCHWMVQGAGIGLKVRGVNFGAGLIAKDIEAQSMRSLFFPKSDYFDQTHSIYGDDERYLTPFEKLHPDKFFYVSIVVKMI
ncbi:hypothetical protein [Dyella sp. OK004]|uniref:hypothetical protein n=1 Tax=Dyella sp. OK004 TaxID=1855292 RepID=UPI001160AD8A|nr:hypothetical protein [Dyella sp. OK004]